GPRPLHVSLNGWRRAAKQWNCPSIQAQTSNVVGGEEPLAKHSAVSAEGRLRLGPIDGLIFCQIRPVPHEDGHVTEVARASWPELVDPVVQVHLTTTLRGRIHAWGLHQKARTACTW